MQVLGFGREIASWSFQDWERDASAADRQILDELLELCQKAAEVLEAQELLFPTTVHVSGWLRALGGKTGYAKGEPDAILTFQPGEVPARELAARCDALMRRAEAERGGFRYPRSLLVRGEGTILDAAGAKVRLPDVMWIECGTLDHHIITVGTQCDAWLPATLRAEPQPEVWRHNAPRLEAALRAIEARLGIEMRWDRVTRYAVNEGYHLVNHSDVDGEINAVID
jgi:hypothetical protein